MNLATKDVEMNILVVGGAGYIGSHYVRQLIHAGHRPVVLDSLVTGHRAAVPENVPFHERDLGDTEYVKTLLRSEAIEAVAHFAAFAYVGESVHEPLAYYRNNVAKSIFLLEAMMQADVRKFIFSSTCATFGIPQALPIDEQTPQVPINPYGETKLVLEKLLKSMTEAGQISTAVFRYFNAAGASLIEDIGECHDPETHLIPLAIGAAAGYYPPLKIFGMDYPTPDGSCLRDYVHVDDICRAHIDVLDRLSGNCFLDYNLGTGTPVSVLEVLKVVEDVVGSPVPHRVASRRKGDPPVLCADARKAREELGWQPRCQTIEEIVKSAWFWHSAHPEGYLKYERTY
jgi:UDP-glucose 4-epimerase